MGYTLTCASRFISCEQNKQKKDVGVRNGNVLWQSSWFETFWFDRQQRLIPSPWTVQPCVQCPHGSCRSAYITVLYAIVLYAIVLWTVSFHVWNLGLVLVWFFNDGKIARVQGTLNVWCGIVTLLALSLVSKEDGMIWGLSKASVLKTRLGKSPPMPAGLSYCDAT